MISYSFADTLRPLERTTYLVTLKGVTQVLKTKSPGELEAERKNAIVAQAFGIPVLHGAIHALDKKTQKAIHMHQKKSHPKPPPSEALYTRYKEIGLLHLLETFVPTHGLVMPYIPHVTFTTIEKNKKDELTQRIIDEYSPGYAIVSAMDIQRDHFAYEEKSDILYTLDSDGLFDNYGDPAESNVALRNLHPLPDGGVIKNFQTINKKLQGIFGAFTYNKGKFIGKCEQHLDMIQNNFSPSLAVLDDGLQTLLEKRAVSLINHMKH